MLETKPLELIYQGPTNVSQVLSPYSASPPKVLLSGFRSRCHIVIKGAFPAARVQQGLAQLIRLYTTAGFPEEELHSISEQLMTQHQNCDTHSKMCASTTFPTESLASCFSFVCCFCFHPSCFSSFPSRRFLAQLPRSFALVAPLRSYGSCSRSRFSSPSGSSHYASQLFGGAFALL